MPETGKLYGTETLIKTHQADMEFVKYMISLFLQHMPESNARLEKACDENNWEQVHFYAHKMKASIDLFDLNQLKDIIRTVDYKAKNKTETGTIADDINFVSEYIKKCMIEMKLDFEIE